MDKGKRFLYRLQDFDLSQPASKRTYNRELFSPVSHVYSKITRVLSFGRDPVWKTELVSSLEERARLKPGSFPPGRMRALDIACGPGDLAFVLASQFPHAAITAVDLNPDMIRKAQENLRSSFPKLRDRITFLPGDMTHIEYPDSTFHFVTGGYALRNAPELEKTLKEIYRVLTPGGAAGFLDFSKTDKPVLRGLELALLSFWGRLWGFFFHRNAEVYGYIAESLKTFPGNREFLGLLKKTGFQVIKFKPIFLGFLHITVVLKPSG